MSAKKREFKFVIEIPEGYQATLVNVCGGVKAIAMKADCQPVIFDHELQKWVQLIERPEIIKELQNDPYLEIAKLRGYL